MGFKRNSWTVHRVLVRAAVIWLGECLEDSDAIIRKYVVCTVMKMYETEVRELSHMSGNDSDEGSG
jgi:vesicle coat complex subunit